MENLSERLRFAMGIRGIGQVGLANSVGMKQPSIHSILIGETQNPRKLLEIANTLDVSAEWLKYGTGPAPTKEEPVKHKERKVTGFSDKASDDWDRLRDEELAKTTLPLYGPVNAAGDVVYLNPDNIVDYVDRVPWLKNNPNAFALRVHGDSMGGVVKDGTIVYVATNMRPKRGELCAIDTTDMGALIKEYIETTETDLICKQYNPEKKIKIPRDKIKGFHLIDGRR